ncbi:hypothetical protein SNE510_05270 [Streptomyces sp. NE5-10]|uniref:hypothetical protein n=1 Tax=Streptomyces sp. NE5-10 TaxID=2759674 RepID=UPI0019048556|nr:hypothetical protein [Streptomyces sp. NE5-10]GHJ91008.1 hypothetical protein SNE510_05270 [Streptomyces sp. NE5-10]
MTGLRGTLASAAVLAAATALSGALVLLSGFVYQLVDGDPTGALLAWALGLLVLAVGLFAVFGGLLPDLDAEPETGPDAAPGDRAAARPAAEKWFDDWFDVLAFCCVLVGLLAGGPLGIAGYEALRPETGTVATEAAAPSTAPGGPAPEGGGPRPADGPS